MLQSPTIWFFGLPRRWKQLIAITYDIVVVFVAVWAAYSLRYDRAYVFKPNHWGMLGLASLVTVGTFVRLGLYRAVLRFMGTQAMLSVVAGVTLSSVALVFADFLFHVHVPRSIPFIYWALALFAIGGSRMLTRHTFHRLTSNRDEREPVVIYGAGASGRQLATALQGGNDFKPIAFLDDDPLKQNTVLNGLRVFSPAELPQLTQTRVISRLLLAISSTVDRARILRSLEDFHGRIQTIPAMAEILNRQAAITELRDINIEDLVGRDAIPPDQALIDDAVGGRVVMVTGAGGSIGSELCRQIIRNRVSRLVLVDICEFALYEIHNELRDWLRRGGLSAELVPIIGSATNAERMEAVMKAFRVETVYHAAAYKHVPMVEYNVVEGVRNNVFGTWHTAKAALRAGVRSFVLVSTDKAVRPTNIMGASKRMAELVLQGISPTQSRTRFTMVRFGNVLGSSGSVVPLFRRQIREGGPVTVTHPEIIRYFMTIPEAASLVIQAGSMGQGGEVFLLDMGEPVKIADLARKLVRLMGRTVKSEADPSGIEITFTGLRPGEKLYEELLVGQESQPTEHPRIMKSHEDGLEWPAVKTLLDELEAACDAFDCNTVRGVLQKAPLAYTPESGCADLVWREGGGVHPVDELQERAARKLVG